jgi:coatomer subunit zeta
MNLTLYSVNGIRYVNCLLTIAILILDSDGNRVLGKYYQSPHLSSVPPTTLQSTYTTTPQPNPYPTLKEQRTFEKGLFEKTKKQTSDVILFDNKLVVYKQAVDVTMYVVGGAEENEIMLYLVVVALRDCLDALLKYHPPFGLGMEAYK